MAFYLAVYAAIALAFCVLIVYIIYRFLEL